MKIFSYLKKILKKNNFSIEDEANRMNMTVDQYKRTVLHEIPKLKLAELYSLYDKEINQLNTEKIKFNNEILYSKKRKNDFNELEQFMNSLE